MELTVVVWHQLLHRWRAHSYLPKGVSVRTGAIAASPKKLAHKKRRQLCGYISDGRSRVPVPASSRYQQGS